MESSEYEDLDALLRSAGWERFRQHVVQEWGTADGGGSRFLSAVTKAANEDDANATARLRQILAAQREIQLMLGWVGQRVQQLNKPELRDLALSRRGSL